MKYLILASIILALFQPLRLCKAVETSKLVIGESTIEDAEKLYKIKKMGHSSASMAAFYTVDVSSIEEYECELGESLLSQTLTFVNGH